MHLLYIIDSISAPGGAERALAALAPRYVAAGVTLDVAYLHDRAGLQEELRSAGASQFSLAGTGGRAGWLWRFGRLLQKRRPDLVHTTLFDADVIGRTGSWFLRVPVVSSLVSLAYGREQLPLGAAHRLKTRFAHSMDLASCRHVVRFHAITLHVAEVMSGRLAFPRSRVDVIPRGRDPKQLGTRTADRREKTRALLGAGSDVRLVLSAARHEYPKGLDVLLHAFRVVAREVPGARLLVAGREGRQTPMLNSIVKSLGMRGVVQFLGVRDDVPDLLCAADAVVVPSRWEGLGSVLIEAMALEAPIVASDIPAIRETLGSPPNAHLVQQGNPDAMARAVISVLTDQAHVKEETRRAHSRFMQRYTIDKISDAMLAFYDRALGTAKTHRGETVGATL